MENKDLIIGVHSIAEAIKNPKRTELELFVAKENLDELKKRGSLSSLDFQRVKVNELTGHQLQEKAKKVYSHMDFHYQRVPSNMFLLATELEEQNLSYVYELLEQKRDLKILCLDQVTDVHNAAAIMRTAAFYGIDALITAVKGSFGKGPSFSRIASGALEYVPVIRCSSLPKTIARLQEKGVCCVALSEHADEKLNISATGPRCLIIGSEDFGISHALQRVVKMKMSLASYGAIKSLNASVAAAVSMERVFADR